jgi:hypothetical protein
MNKEELGCHDADWIKLEQDQFQWWDFNVDIVSFQLPLHKQDCLFDKNT